MTHRGRCVLGLVILATLVLPGVASAHAYLVKTVPSASGTVNTPPSQVALTFDEAVEPRFAIISVTDENAHQETTAPVHRSPTNPDTLIVPLRPHLPEGWYLVYWRAISVDGHPVQGAFTFAIGPNPGPQAQFTIPKIAGTATTTRLLVARWVMFLGVMVALGLFVFRFLIARPVVRRVPGTSLRSVDIAFGVSAVVGLIAIPVVSRHRDLDRLAAIGLRHRQPGAALPGHCLRARLRRLRDLLRIVLCGSSRRALAGPPRPRAAVDRGDDRGSRRADGGCGRARDPRRLGSRCTDVAPRPVRWQRTGCI